MIIIAPEKVMKKRKKQQKKKNETKLTKSTATSMILPTSCHAQNAYEAYINAS